MNKGQGALEYLLLIGGAVAVAAIVVAMLLNFSGALNQGGFSNAQRDLAIKQHITNKTMVLYWKFEETSGNIVDSSLNQIPSYFYGYSNSSRPGKYGKSFFSDWSNENVAFTKSNVPGLPVGNSPRTIAVWINTNYADWGGSGDILMMGQGGSAGQIFGIAPSAEEELSLWIGGGTNIGSGLGIPYNQWQFLAVVYDGSGNVTFYSDKGSQSVSIPGGQLNTQPSRVFAGASTSNNGGSISESNPGSFDNHIPTYIDEVMIFNKALSPQEIAVIRGT